MGWTSSGDMAQQIRLRFDTAEEAVAYCERHGIAYQVFAPKHTSPHRRCPTRTISPSSVATLGLTERLKLLDA